ncbi:fructose-bisphosphate aldolase, class II [Marchantia polymorpha subsp. ruderalis]|uniref:L-threonate dehydrogenase n=1 Tax=Marchantia polymorpha TaxID=3197 RepID=A0A2R6WGA1_MARPO|nr:hypothetical protein MARPO_0094s0055 [Marchantia polymorpha]BBN02755.1 hypothetical protein Mp_2g17860 [Marchantia polymorpha subsp. ruderalis]|eukprot:PTQ32882.1 hypothetical protein MARPO_0094s0055 [Marchantia polymorpha]
MARPKVALIGDGEGDFAALRTHIASRILDKGFNVAEVDVTQSSDLSDESVATASEQAIKDAGVILVAVSNTRISECLRSVTISELSDGAVVLICSPVTPRELMTVEKSFSVEREDMQLVDAPLTRTFDGTLMMVASGAADAVTKCRDVLHAIDDNFLDIEGGLGTSSKLRMVDDLLFGVHLAAAAESMALGACAGLETQILYDIISNAAGSSRVFANLVPHMLKAKDGPIAKLDQVYNQLGFILDEAKGLKFPLPLTAVAHQQVVNGCASGYKNEKCSSLFKIWEKIIASSTASSSSVGNVGTMDELAKVALKVDSVAFIGLGAMGFGMASHLVKEGFTVRGYDVYEPSMERFVKAGGIPSKSPEDCAKGAKVIILMVTNEDQAESVLYGQQGAVQGIAEGCTVVLCSTVSPAFVMRLETRLAAEGRDLQLVDAPVSGGVAKAADGTLTIMASGSEEAFKRAGSCLLAMGANVYVLKGGAGLGSSVKMVNQLLAGVHIAVSAEAMAFGVRLGLESRSLYDFIEKSNGCSWMFTNRVPHMLSSDYTPLSAVDIFVKDLGIVFSEGKRLCVPLPVASTALQQYLLSAAAGWGRLDDSAVVKVFEKMTGITIQSKTFSSEPAIGKGADIPVIPKDATLNSLPPEWSEDPLDEIKRVEKEGRAKVLVVLDDDPTGTQTVHDVNVLTDWSVDVLKEEFDKKPACFFILTNSRALNHEEAAELTVEICKQVVAAASAAGDIGYTIVLRGDSTLRGHFPQEPNAAASVIGESDAWIICPFFLQGGRYTINDIHYVADENMLVPAGSTEFAKDAVFGYKSSNLLEWVEEKTEGRVAAKDVASISIDTIRKGGPAAVCQTLCSLKKGTVCVVNAASERDVEVFAAGMMRAEAMGKQFLCRTAAAFVSARIGLRPTVPLTPKDLGSLNTTGGLIVVGSYVPKTTKQVEEARASCKDLVWINVDVASVTSDTLTREVEIEQAALSATQALTAGMDTVIMTSRDLVTGSSKEESLKIGLSVSSALVEVVKRISVRPRYILAKGGITSSDVATKGMDVRKALVVGQALPGVPLWQFGPGSRHPGLPYIVFPGNVGGTDALAKVVQQWSKPPSNATKDMLQEAKRGGYAIGAFNVYNMEGILAVVAAAEAEKSPVILQIHPASLRSGGLPLVAACLSAAKSSTVPVSVHLDHGDQKQDTLQAICSGFNSIMVDGSKLSFHDNIQFTRTLARAAHAKGMLVEAELGRLSGTEDGLTVEEYEALLTDTKQAEEFLGETKVDALAVCIGNVHGKYPASGPKLKLDLLQDLNLVAERHNAVLVLHGASGVPDRDVKACIDRGVVKFNVNTEVREAYMDIFKTQHKDLVDVLRSSKQAMEKVIVAKLRLFGSSGKAT